MNLPALRSVTLLTICAELPAMEVSVTILAMNSHVRENQVRVTLRTTDLDVHSEQRIFGAVVIEFGDAADRFPA